MRFSRSILSYLHLLVAATVFPFLCLVAYGYYSDVQREAAHAKAIASSLAEMAAADAGEFVAQGRGYLQILARERSVRSPQPAACGQNTLGSFHVLHPEFASLILLDMNGRVVCATVSRSATGLSMTDEDWFRKIAAGESFVVGLPAASKFNGRRIAVLAHAVRDGNGPLLGVVALTMDLVRYQPLPSGVGLPPGTVVTLLTSEGTILARSAEADARVGQNIRATPMGEHLQHNRAGEGEFADVDGVRRLSGYSPVAGAGWVAVAGIPVGAAFADVQARAVHSGILLGLAAIAAIGLALLVARWVALPVRQVADAARALAEGHLDTRLTPGGPREVVEVAEQFNRMLDVRDQAETALGESQKRLQALFDNMRDGILLVDRNAVHVGANPALCDLLGYSREEMLRMALWNDVPPDMLPQLQDLWSRFLAAGWLEGVFTVMRKDGRTLEVEYRAVANFMPDLHLCSVRDITERRHLEQQVRESEARYRRLVEQIPAIVYLAPGDRPQDTNYVSPYIERVLGIPAADFIAEPGAWAKYLHPDDRDRVLAERDTARADVQRFVREYRMLASDGRTVWLRDEGNFLRDESGAPIALQGLLIDITELKQAEDTRDALARERDALLDRLTLEFERMPIGCIVTDEEFRITGWNPAAEKIFGLMRAEVWGKAPRDLIVAPDNIADFEDQLQEMSQGRATKKVVRENLTKDGRTIICEWHGTPLYNQAEKRFIGMLAMVEDITERRQAEEKEARYTEHLKLLSRRLVEVQEDERRHLAWELHDRTGQNLTAINLHLSVIREQIPPEAAAMRARLVDAMALVAATLDAVRDVMADLRSPVLEDYGLLAAIRWYGDIFARRSGLLVAASGTEPSPRLQRATETALFRVVQEALTNVVKHANASRVEVVLEPGPQSVRLTIADDGVGFNLDSERQAGGGWGIVSMEERVEAVGGLLQVHSLPGRGTRIEVEVPILGC